MNLKTNSDRGGAPSDRYEKSITCPQDSQDSASCKAFNVVWCSFCNSENLEIREGKGPHAGALYCADCERWLKWISKSLIAAWGGVE
jgi:hypothetical protein